MSNSQGGAAPNNIEQVILDSETNKGFPVSQVIPLWTCKTSGGLTLTASTTPVIASTSSYEFISWAASDSSSLLIPSGVPFEYDPAMDELYLDLLLNQTGTTDTITVNATAQVARAGTAITTAKTSTGAVTAASGQATGVAVWRRISFKSKVFRPRDQIQFLVTPGAHTTDALNLFGAELVYVRNSCFNNRNSRFLRSVTAP